MSTKVFDAIYRGTSVAHYKGNPYIEALPPMMSLEQATSVLSVYPDMSDKELELEPHVRRHCVGRLFGFVQAAPLYVDCFWSFDELLRGGYVGRDPSSAKYQHHLYNVQDNEERTVEAELQFAATSGVLMLQGASGQGKTTLVSRILACYPQVIQHTEYRGAKLVQPQVVWLKITCPHDGSLKQLCIAFFESLDAALHTKYAEKYANGRFGVPQLLNAMRQLCATYSVGVLVIDELQHLSLAKVGGKRKMMNFFVNLVNDVGVPLMLIGTYAASSLFREAMRDARRATGDGLKDFRRPEKDDKWWNFLVETAWEYQWTNDKAPLTDDVRALLYDLTQGITDFLIKLIVLSQRRALRLNRSSVTAADLRYVSNNELLLLKPAIAALRIGTPRALSLYEDLLPTKESTQQHIEVLDASSRETAEDVLAALEAAKIKKRCKSPDSDPDPASSELGLPQESESVVEIKACAAKNSLLSSLGKVSVSADLESRGLVVNAMA